MHIPVHNRGHSNGQHTRDYTFEKQNLELQHSLLLEASLPASMIAIFDSTCCDLSSIAHRGWNEINQWKYLMQCRMSNSNFITQIPWRWNAHHVWGTRTETWGNTIELLSPNHAHIKSSYAEHVDKSRLLGHTPS